MTAHWGVMEFMQKCPYLTLVGYTCLILYLVNATYPTQGVGIGILGSTSVHNFVIILRQLNPPTH